MDYFNVLSSIVSADKFRYTCMGGEISIEGVNDKKDMEETRRTFAMLGKNCLSCNFLIGFKFLLELYLSPSASPGLKEDFQADVFKVLAAILHLGNVEIKNSGGDKSSVSVSLSSPYRKLLFVCEVRFTNLFPDFYIIQPSDPHLEAFCELLGVSAEGLVHWLCHRRIVMVTETVVKPVPKERAVNSRDALAKQIYAHLFDCIITRINTVLQVPGKQHTFIGVLDIYG